jgi:uncharacterized membrane protein
MRRLLRSLPASLLLSAAVYGRLKLWDRCADSVAAFACAAMFVTATYAFFIHAGPGPGE